MSNINLFSSKALRRVRKFGVTFFWAFIFSGLLAPAAYYRLPRTGPGDDLHWHEALRLLVNRLEWVTYDWRSRQLGATSEVIDDVVLITADEQTMLNARQADHPEGVLHPLSREMTGQLVQQAIDEGAALVVVGESFKDVSPSTCAQGGGVSDDEQFAGYLERHAEKVILGFEWHSKPRSAAERAFMPFLVQVETVSLQADALPTIGRVLSRSRPAWLIPRSEGQGGYTVWAGAVDPTEAKKLASVLRVTGALKIRPLVLEDEPWRVDRYWLSQQLAKVPVVQALKAPRAASMDVPVPALLSSQVGLGAMSLLSDADGVVRGIPLFIQREATFMTSVALQAAMRRSESPKIQFRDGHLKLGDFSVPVDAEGFLRMRFPGAEGYGTWRRSVMAWRLLVNSRDDATGKGVRRYDNKLEGRVVVLATDDEPLYTTPIGTLSRAAITAEAIANVIHNHGITRVAPAMDVWLTIALAFFGALLALAWSTLARRPGWLAWVMTIAVVSGSYAFIARHVFISQHLWMAMAIPLCACALTFLASLGYVRTLEHSLREFAFRALGGAVYADAFHTAERNLSFMHPERRTLTVYFSDIEGFTSATQEREPEAMVKVLRQYLSTLTPVILESKGHVDKYLGDGLMAFWGAPEELPAQSKVACKVALQLCAEFEAKRAEWESICGRTLMMRAGIALGPTVVGEMGTNYRLNYTVLGMPVVAAFRLETLAKRYGVRILVGESVRQEAGDAFLFRPIDVLRLSREGIPIELFELLGDAASPMHWLGDFDRAYGFWRASRFEEALAIFNDLARLRPDDKVVSRYLRRCQASIRQPPMQPWDGVYVGPDDA